MKISFLKFEKLHEWEQFRLTNADSAFFLHLTYYMLDYYCHSLETSQE